jgi:hypothetical protein
MADHRSKFLLLTGMLVLAMVLVPSIALANNGPHGGFAPDTDQCAACHRAHTAPSSVQWHYQSAGTTMAGSALLLGTSSFLPDFCLTCHGKTGQGADTNVIDGLYMPRLSGGSGAPGATLLSGPFGDPDSKDTSNTLGLGYVTPSGGGTPVQTAVTSKHEYGGAGSWGAWGGGTYGAKAGETSSTWQGWFGPGSGKNGTGQTEIPMDCATCHDVHGSSNYRLLKDQVYGVTVGGYNADVPDPYVISAEKGYPTSGFPKHSKVTGYEPNYTQPRYAKNDGTRGMAGWCTGCHTYYMGSGTYGAATSPPSLPNPNISRATTYFAENVGAPEAGGVGTGTYGKVTRYRHPNNVPLSNFKGTVPVIADNGKTPLEHAASEGNTDVNFDDPLPIDNNDNVSCLSCHYAHGTTAMMSGYANDLDPTNPGDLPGPTSGVMRGVQPTLSSALLRDNNRTACEACHNK